MKIIALLAGVIAMLCLGLWAGHERLKAAGTELSVIREQLRVQTAFAGEMESLAKARAQSLAEREAELASIQTHTRQMSTAVSAAVRAAPLPIGAKHEQLPEACLAVAVSLGVDRVLTEAFADPSGSGG